MPIYPKSNLVSSKALVALGSVVCPLWWVDKFPSAEALLDGQEPSQPFLLVPRG